MLLIPEKGYEISGGKKYLDFPEVIKCLFNDERFFQRNNKKANTA